MICGCLQDIEEGKVSVHHDLLSILMKTLDHESHVITNETIKDNMLTYWIASHDTVSTTLSLVLKYLFLNPHCLHEVVKGKTHDQTMFTPIKFYSLFVFIFENLKKKIPLKILWCYIPFFKRLCMCGFHRTKGDNESKRWDDFKLGRHTTYEIHMVGDPRNIALTTHRRGSIPSNPPRLWIQRIHNSKRMEGKIVYTWGMNIYSMFIHCVFLTLMDNSIKNLIFIMSKGSCFLHITNYSSICWNHWNDRYFGQLHLPKCRLKFSHIPQSLIHEGLKEDHHHLSLLCHLEEDIGHVLAKNMHTRWWWYFCIIWSSIMNGQWLTPMKKLLLILCQSSKRDFNWKFKKKIGEKGNQ